MTRTETIQKGIRAEIKYLIGAGMFLVGVVAPFYAIKEDVSLIENNHLRHSEQSLKAIEKNSEDIKELRERDIELMEVISEWRYSSK